MSVAMLPGTLLPLQNGAPLFSYSCLVSPESVYTWQAHESDFVNRPVVCQMY